ncbi:putative F-box only protein 9 [Raphanus sativus]|nr:putative F-box only protein 9 [Raphanus sativus]
MMMSDMPQDLLEEILSRVPAVSLKRLRSTCKRWNDLLKDERFTEKHFLKAPKQSRILMSDDYRICSLDVDLNVAPPAIEFKGPLGLRDMRQFDTDEIFHCDGLLLCSSKYENRLMIWNPCLGETRWIETTTTDSEDLLSYCSFALGYQNNKSFRSFKILKCWNRVFHIEGFEIYDLSSDSWRVLDDLALNCWILDSGVSLKGNAYWLALGETGFFLLGFDFTRDIFVRFCLPQLEDRSTINLSVVRDEKLSLLHCPRYASHVEVWVTHEIDTQAALWSKSFIVKLHSLPYHYLISLRIESFLIDEENKVALCSYPGSGDSKKLFICGEDNEYYRQIPCAGTTNPVIFSYVPSLFRVQQSGSK